MSYLHVLRVDVSVHVSLISDKDDDFRSDKAQCQSPGAVQQATEPQKEESECTIKRNDTYT
ncbi:hypothetical protein E2C01_062049 [Portunus trituberculatus]|uniref:Uncharacterized protein n=1 Tax=Portunus trituberculatus TaxID=210409 RepID=A0A5B7HCK2_PORTR|nr:hypothetical protein [Portunus trituberculatus]